MLKKKKGLRNVLLVNAQGGLLLLIVIALGSSPQMPRGDLMLK